MASPEHKTGASDPLTHGDALAPGLIHEMRHPLMGIKSGLQMLERTLGATVSATEEWQLISGQVMRLEELFRRYQEFLHPEEVRPGPYTVLPVVKSAAELVRYRTRRLGDLFSIEAPTQPIEAFGTPNALSHALTNLLLNALDAIDEVGGKRRLSIRILEPREGGPVEVRVSDEGGGIPADVAPQLFQTRITTKPAGKGTGLGLGVARRMVAAYGGTVRLAELADPRRAPWARTEFVIELLPASGRGVGGDPRTPARQTPAAPVPSPAAAKTAPPAHGSPAAGAPPSSARGSAAPPAAATSAGSTAATSSSAASSAAAPSSAAASAPRASAPSRPAPEAAELDALIVDDEEVILLLLKQALTREGYRVTQTSNGNDAARLLGSRKFDLLVTDKNLPGRNGVELATLARTTHPDTRVILITAYASRESAKALLKLGIDEYLQKPFELDYLTARLKDLKVRRNAPPPMPTTEEGKGKRVLVVDQDVRTIEQIRGVLDRLSAIAVGTSDLLLGLRGSPPPSAVVIPAAMLNAPARRELWAAKQARPGFGVVVISEGGSLADDIAAISVGASGQLYRPLDPQAMEEAFRFALGIKAS